MTVEFKEQSKLYQKISIFPSGFIQDIKEKILFNASFSANLHCPGCFMIKRLGQRESFFDYQGNLLTFHVYNDRNILTIEDCEANQINAND